LETPTDAWGHGASGDYAMTGPRVSAKQSAVKSGKVELDGIGVYYDVHGTELSRQPTEQDMYQGHDQVAAIENTVLEKAKSCSSAWDYFCPAEHGGYEPGGPDLGMMRGVATPARSASTRLIHSASVVETHD
jgi:hypothetical protein